jgi:hypothetical protein
VTAPVYYGGGTACPGAGRGRRDARLGWRQRRKGLVASLYCLTVGANKEHTHYTTAAASFKISDRRCACPLYLSLLSHTYMLHACTPLLSRSI